MEVWGEGGGRMESHFTSSFFPVRETRGDQFALHLPRQNYVALERSFIMLKSRAMLWILGSKRW